MRPALLLVPVFALLLGVPTLAEDTNSHDTMETAGDAGEPVEYCRETCQSLHGTTQGREYIDCLRRCVTGDASTAATGPRARPRAGVKHHHPTMIKSIDKSSPKLQQAVTNGQPLGPATPPPARQKRAR